MEQPQLKAILEALIMSSNTPLSVDRLLAVFAEAERPEKTDLRAALSALQADYADKSIELKEVGSGFRFQVRKQFSEWVSRLWEERPQRYSRALLETLALIAYKQPITRGDIEQIRGVAVNTQIIKTLLERDWIEILGERDVPGRPSLYGTTPQFLDYFNLTTLEDLPSLPPVRDLEQISAELNLDLASTVDNPAVTDKVIALPVDAADAASDTTVAESATAS
jgi:segregation and condensation protein B